MTMRVSRCAVCCVMQKRRKEKKKEENAYDAQAFYATPARKRREM